MLEQTQERGAIRADGGQYRRRMLLALALLLTALVVMLVKDRSFWFGGEEVSVTDETPSVIEPSAAPVPNQAVQAALPIAVATVSVKKHEAAKHTAAPAAEGTSVIATDRGVLKPLEIEVVNGKTRRKLQADASTVKVDMQSDESARELAPVTNAVQQTRIGAEKIEAEKTQPGQPTYPSLAGQMRVQGSVLLQALIGADGVIQEVRVISGPAILSSAAREAARQWRFKPYLQNGKAVETQARITVNFVIKVWNDEARDSDAFGKSTRPAKVAAHPGA